MSAPQPQLRVGTRVRKQFVPESGGELVWFEGTVVDFVNGRWWRVRYDDGDVDDNRADELSVVTLSSTPPPRKAARTPSRPSPASAVQPVAGPASPPLTWKKKAEARPTPAHVSRWLRCRRRWARSAWRGRRSMPSRG
jgi:hypothetical protein